MTGPRFDFSALNRGGGSNLPSAGAAPKFDFSALEPDREQDDEDEGVLEYYLWNLPLYGAKAAGNFLFNPKSWTREESDRQIKLSQEAVQGMKSNISKTYNYLKDNLNSVEKVKAAASNAWDKFDPMSGGVGVFKGGLKMFGQMVETPIELLTGTQRKGSAATPATPEEFTQTMQDAAGQSLGFMTGGLVSKLAYNLLGMPLTPTVKGAFKVVNRAPLGNLGRAVAAEGLASIPLGGLSGAVSGLGQTEEYLPNLVNSTLTLPAVALGSAFGVMGKGQVERTARIKVADYIGNQKLTAPDLALAQDIQINPKSTADELAANVISFATSDDLLAANIKSRLSQDFIYTLPDDLPPERVENVLKQLKWEDPDIKINEDVLAESHKLQIAKPKYGTKVANYTPEFESLFDKLAYMYQSKVGKGKNTDWIDELIPKLGISKEALIEHGKNVKVAVADAVVLARTPAEIENVKVDAINRGREILAKSIEKQVLNPGDAQKWVRTGNTIQSIAPDGTVLSLDVNDPRAAEVVGLNQDAQAALADYKRVGKVAYNPNANKPLANLQVLRSEGTGRTIVAPAKMQNLKGEMQEVKFTAKAKELFDKTGYLPGEIVVDAATGEMIKINKLLPHSDPGKVSLELQRIERQNSLDNPNRQMVTNITLEQLQKETQRYPNANLLPEAIEGYDKFIGFHGTKQVFDNLDFEKTAHFGVHFGTKEQANFVSTQKGKGRPAAKAPPRTIRAILDIKNPLRVPDLNNWNPIALVDAIVNNLAVNGDITDTEATNIQNDFLAINNNKLDLGVGEKGIVKKMYSQIPPLLEKYGYDGLIYENNYEGGGDSLIAIRNDQIKETYGPAEKSKFIAWGNLTKPGYLDAVYNDFKKSFDMDAISSEAFGGRLAKYLQEKGFQYADIDFASQYIYKRLNDDIAKGLPTDELLLREKAKDVIKELYIERTKDYYQYIIDAASGSGKWFENVGNAYNIYDQATGKLLERVGSLEEVGKYLGTTRAEIGIPLDGGPAGQIDPAFANMGRLSPSRYKYNENPVAKFLTKLRTTPFYGRMFEPVYERFVAWGNKSTGDGTGAAFADGVARVNSSLHGWIEANLRPEIDKINELGKQVKNTQSAERITGWLSTASIDKLMKSANPREASIAQEINKLGAPIELVKKMMYYRRLFNDGKITQAELDEVRKQITPAAGQAVSLLEASVTDPEVRTDKIIRLADALEHPVSAVDKNTYVQRTGMSVEEVEVAKQYQKLLADLAKKADIEPDRLIEDYIPIMRQYGDLVNSRWFKAGESETRFLNELTRLGITPSELQALDIRELTARYAMGLARARSGYGEQVNELRKLLDDWVTRTKEKNPELAQTILNEGNEWIDNTTGRRHIDGDYDAFVFKLFGKDFKIDAGSFMSAIGVLKLGFKPSMLALDVASAMQMIGGTYGLKFFKDVTTRKITDRYVHELMLAGDIPPVAGQALINMDVTYFNDDVIRKLSDAGQYLSGQKWAYAKLLGGMFKETQLASLKATTNYKDFATTKKKLGNLLSANSVEVQKYYERLVESGKYEEAAKYLARYNSGRMANRYGEMYNPLGWQKNPVGRLYGQFGSWGANATSWAMDNLANGTMREIAGRASRTTAISAAVYGAMYAAGLDPSRMIVNPLFTMPTGGPIISALNAASQIQNLASPDEERREWAKQELGLGLRGLVMPAVLNNILKAGEAWQAGYSNLQTAGQAVGVPYNRDRY